MGKMEDGSWKPVYGSSNVIGIRYHEPSKECFVKFTDRTVYVYEDVPKEVWEELVHAGSKGRYVNIVLRRGYKYHRDTEAAIKKEEENGG
jgi:hypothetical protein